MGNAMELAVERVIATMRDNLGEQLTVDDMARAAMFSKFHFSRIFLRVTGVSPGRFLSALRLQRAKQLLVSTSSNVADISISVGYNSVGTFSSRFTRSVGLSPTMYRRLGGSTCQIPMMDADVDVADLASGVVQGHIESNPANAPGLIFVGLFPHRIPEGRPVRCTILDHSGPFVLDKVPEGVWYLLSQSVSADVDGAAWSPVADERAMSVGVHGPITVGPDMVVQGADLRLRPMCTFDPPVLLALPDARQAGLRVLASREACGLADDEAACLAENAAAA